MQVTISNLSETSFIHSILFGLNSQALEKCPAIASKQTSLHLSDGQPLYKSNSTDWFDQLHSFRFSPHYYSFYQLTKISCNSQGFEVVIPFVFQIIESVPATRFISCLPTSLKSVFNNFTTYDYRSRIFFVLFVLLFLKLFVYQSFEDLLELYS